MSGLLEDIRQTLASTPRNVVFIVGAGVSVGALRGSPRAALGSWVGLLEDGLRRARDLGALDGRAHDLYRQQLSLPDTQAALGVAEVVCHRLGAPHGGEYSRWLRETVGSFHLDVRDSAVLDALAAHGRRGALLATTNYDHLLEAATALKPTTWRRPAVVERALQGVEPRILHLHGEWEDPDSIVLGIRSYVDVSRDPHAQTVLATLRAARTFVFVGCGAGLSDPNLGAFLRWTGDVFSRSESRHYRLCLTHEVEALRREHPPGQRIFPLAYGNSHAELAPFLRRLLSSDGWPRAETSSATGRGSWSGSLQGGSFGVDPSPAEPPRAGATFSALSEFDAPPRLLQASPRGTALLAGGLAFAVLGAVCMLRESGAEAETKPETAPEVVRGATAAEPGILGGLAGTTPKSSASCPKQPSIAGRWQVTTSVDWAADAKYSGVSGYYTIDVTPKADCRVSVILRKTGDSGKSKYKQPYQDRVETRLVAGATMVEFEAWLGPGKPLDKAGLRRDTDWHYRFVLRAEKGRMEGSWKMFDRKSGGTQMRGALSGGQVLPSPYGGGF
ncbi:SIR2 family NAD-dependent protein deacylase [Nannocystis punicea]|uniref:SIR2 family protein n=1 Tax=Nannocystis punicea TaxID=2995304 RepID=A0ABY7H6Q7_9BACT|nr:SIR2 family protein [Nannocystis poenicansa]WAS94956.1 SIR2 family protein [Nannocystis poenicansa]